MSFSKRNWGIFLFIGFFILFISGCRHLPPSGSAPQPDANVHNIHTTEALVQVLPLLQPGDEVILASGEYSNAGVLLLESSGTPDSPIVIRADRMNGVVFTGELRMKISGSHIVLKGLRFENCRVQPSDERWTSLIVSRNETRNIRISGCQFISCEAERRENGSTKGALLNLHGDQHRVDHNVFYDIQGVILGVRGDTDQMKKRIKGEVRIDHNLFRDSTRWRKEAQQGEAIFMGSGFSHYRTQPLGAVIEFNVFDQAIGDTHGEIITVKASQNIIRNNVFAHGPKAWFEGGAHLSIRHSDETLVEQNLFYNLGCGIWLTGRNHIIRNNIFHEIDFAGMYFPSGNLKAVEDDVAVIMVDHERVVMSEPDSYSFITKEYGAVNWAAQSCLIEQNTFSDLKKFAFYMRDNVKADRGFIPPAENRIQGNLFHVLKQIEPAPLMHVDQPELNTFQDNLFLIPEEVNLRPQGDTSRVVRPGEDSQTDMWMELELPRGEPGYGAKIPFDIPAVPPKPGSRHSLPLRAEFELLRSSTAVNAPVLLDAAFSGGEVTEYRWDFGNGVQLTTTVNACVYAWESPGTYQVRLTVRTSDGENATVKKKIRVHAL